MIITDIAEMVKAMDAVTGMLLLNAADPMTAMNIPAE